MKSVPEKELEDILIKIFIYESKNMNKRQTRILLDDITKRCIANKQNYPDIFDKCLEKVLSSKDFERVATTTAESAVAATRLL